MDDGTREIESIMLGIKAENSGATWTERDADRRKAHT
jgi:hypothetical protein